MKNRHIFRYLFALCLYGTIGLFLHFTAYSSEFVALCRGLLGSLFIMTVFLIRKRKISFEAIRENIALLALSGIALGLNWVFLFAGYRYGVAVSSLCNYVAPVVVVVITALFYKEKINLKQVCCIITAFMGMLLLLGIFEGKTETDMHCIVYGLAAAVGFVILVLCNRRLRDIEPLEKTLVQLLFSALTVLPYVCFNSGFPVVFDLRSTLIVLMLGILHTGVAYICYFSSINVLPAQSIAVLGYLEPVLNLVIGAVILHERIGISGMIGAVFIILASVGNELFADENKENA
ncbi:MAG: DMT family transporter [Erysipelotrichaceae bacterium]|nr:DMT family transporter [Erysipelotrichaceae bacterium]